MKKADYTESAQILKALAHPTRLKLLNVIRDQDHPCVSYLGESVGLAQANISQHLSLMRHVGIVEANRDGNQVCYRIKNKRIHDLLNVVLD